MPACNFSFNNIQIEQNYTLLTKLRNMKLFFSCVAILLFSSFSTDTLQSKKEKELYEQIMLYRHSLKLPSIPLSKSLTIVAQTHVKDLDTYKPDQKKSCNLHSWSKNGKWTSCCYTADHSKASCMWRKPSELTNYSAYGYEIAHWSSLPVTAKGALDSWKNSKGHNEVVTNKGIWQDYEWQAIGIGIKNNYAVVWFGEKKEL